MAKKKKPVKEEAKIEEIKIEKPKNEEMIKGNKKNWPNFILDNVGKIDITAPVYAGFRVWIKAKKNKEVTQLFYIDEEWLDLIEEYKNEPAK